MSGGRGGGAHGRGQRWHWSAASPNSRSSCGIRVCVCARGPPRVCVIVCARCCVGSEERFGEGAVRERERTLGDTLHRTRSPPLGVDSCPSCSFASALEEPDLKLDLDSRVHLGHFLQPRAPRPWLVDDDVCRWSARQSERDVEEQPRSEDTCSESVMYYLKESGPGTEHRSDEMRRLFLVSCVDEDAQD